NAAFYGVSWAIYRYLVDYHDPVHASGPRPTTLRARVRAAGQRYGRLLARSHVLLLAPTWIALNAAISTIASFQIVFQLRDADSPFADEQFLMRGVSAAEMSAGLGIGMVVF